LKLNVIPKRGQKLFLWFINGLTDLP